MWLTSIVLVSLYGLSYGVVYDYYTENPASKCLLSQYEKANVTKTCTIDVKPCDPNEWRRVDGSCNNLKKPARGTFLSKLDRILPPHYHNGYEARKAKSGADLPLARVVRLFLLAVGASSHHLFNHNVPGFAIYKFNDCGSVHDIENLLLNTTYCCEKEHQNDRACTPNILPDDDPVFRFTNIRCMNSTRPLTHQDFGCTKDKVPSMIKKATAFFDESQIYDANGKGDKVLRTFKNGMLIVEEEEGKLFPPNGPTAFCPLNRAPEETRCFENHFNTLLPITLFNIWFVRHHNFIASKLAEVNPCWDDDTLFYTAREINIAYSNQMYFYEWSEAVQGRKNLLKAGILTKDNGFRDLYDENQNSQLTLEWTYLKRWFHLMQESTAKLHDKHGNFIENFPLFNATFRIGFVAKHMEEFTQSTFRAPCHAIDGTVTFDIANRGLSEMQEALDVTAGDLNKGRSFGIAPFVDYVYHFTGFKIKSFKDLGRYIDENHIEMIEELYEVVEDLDLLAGMWACKTMEGGHIPELMAAVLNDNYYRAARSDRHWYERKDRPHAFDLPQLKEVRKATLALLMCNVADGVTEIPENAFLTISKKNPLVPCSKIPKMNFKKWADKSCKANESDKNHTAH